MNEKAIDFPNLGIHLNSVPKSFFIGSFEVAFYGVTMGIAILAGLFLARREAERTGQDPELYLDYVLYAVICSVIGARIYYVAFSWDSYKNNPLQIFNIRQGGLAIYGAVIAAVLTMLAYAKIKKQKFWLMADTGCLGLVLGQIIGRWGNFFNREAFGDYTNNLLAMRLPKAAVRSGEITDQMRQHAVDGTIQVHPTFLYESLWNLGVLLFLLFYRKRKHFDGELAFIYLGGYGLGRLWIEGLRTDQLILWHTNIPVSQLLAGCLVLVSACALILGNRKAKKLSGEKPETEELETEK